jgi:hypothetical protein
MMGPVEGRSFLGEPPIVGVASEQQNMPWPSPERVAQVSIGVLFWPTCRTLGEYYRREWTLGAEIRLKAFEPFVAGLLVVITGTIVAVTLGWSPWRYQIRSSDLASFSRIARL